MIKDFIIFVLKFKCMVEIEKHHFYDLVNMRYYLEGWNPIVPTLKNQVILAFLIDNYDGKIRQNISTE